MCDILLLAMHEGGLEFLQLLEQLVCKLSSVVYLGSYPVMSNPYFPQLSFSSVTETPSIHL